jgi:hypothetical protein
MEVIFVTVFVVTMLPCSPSLMECWTGTDARQGEVSTPRFVPFLRHTEQDVFGNI